MNLSENFSPKINLPKGIDRLVVSEATGERLLKACDGSRLPEEPKSIHGYYAGTIGGVDLFTSPVLPDHLVLALGDGHVTHILEIEEVFNGPTNSE